MGWFKSIKKIAGKVAPLAALIPGIGLPAAIAIGAGGGLLSGGGIKGALAGGLGAAALGGGGTLLGNALGATSTATASGIGGAALGAGSGLLSGGGLKGAAIGGLAGGIGGYYSGGGFDGLGESLGITGDNGLLSGVGKAFSGIGDSLGIGGNLNKGYNPGDIISGPIGTTGQLAGAGSGAGMSSFSNGVGNLLSGFSSMKANDDAEKALLAAQGRSLNAIEPYLNAKFEPGDLTQDPGYQFRLQQGQQAMDRSLGARGSLFSGQALKASQDYGQGLADSTYNDAYQRFLAQNQQNIGAAGMATNVFDNQGNIQAAAGINNSNVLNRTASGLFGNGAFGNQGQSLGTSGLTAEQIAQLLAASKSKSAFG